MNQPTKTLKESILDATRADAIPEGEAALWYIRKVTVNKPTFAERNEGQFRIVPPGRWTYLLRWTDATIGQTMGEVVMHDTPDEVNTHLGFMLRSHGRVLITGLGLGCVVRGTLANPAVKSVTVIESSAHVLKLVRPYMPADKRLNIVHDDAMRWVKRSRSRFDCAWHDLWIDTGHGEPHLQQLHMELLCALHRRIPMQGAWAFPKRFRRLMKPQGVI